MTLDDNVNHHLSEVVCRQKVLTAVGTGTLAGIAGCSGGDSGGANGDGSDGEGGSPVETLCGELSADEYVAYDAGETPLFANFDAPSPLVDDLEPYLPGVHRALVTAGDFSELVVDVIQMVQEDQVDGEPVEREQYPVLTEVEFNGETVPAYGRPEEVQDRVGSDQVMSRTASLDLPYVVNDTKLYFGTTVRVELDFAPEDIPEDCRELPEQVAVAMAESFRLNEANTVEQYINDNWENPP